MKGEGRPARNGPRYDQPPETLSGGTALQAAYGGFLIALESARANGAMTVQTFLNLVAIRVAHEEASRIGEEWLA